MKNFNCGHTTKKRFLLCDKIVSVIIVFVVLLGLLQLIMTHCLSNYGDRLKQIENEIALLESDNLLLADEVYSAGSLSQIDKKARSMGLQKSLGVVNSSQKYVATSN